MVASPGPSDVSRQALTVFSRKDTRMCRTSRPLALLARLARALVLVCVAGLLAPSAFAARASAPSEALPAARTLIAAVDRLQASAGRAFGHDAQAPRHAPERGPASRIQRSFRSLVPVPAPARGRKHPQTDPELRIRVAGREDAAAISTLISDLAARFMATDCDAPTRRQLLATMTPEAIRRYLERGYHYHVGEIDGRLVGVVGTRHHTHIHHLFVAESEHGKGYASRLWEHVRASGAAAGTHGEFTVNASPYALAIYRRWGFLPDGERREQDGLVDIPMRWTQAAQAYRNDDFLPDVPPA